MKTKVFRLLSSVFLVTGFISVSCSALLIYQHYSPTRIAFASEKLLSSVSTSSNLGVKSVTISDVGISLPVYEGSIKEGKWEVSSQGVTHLSQTVLPGERGNSVLYGHNWTSLLGNLVKVKPGAVVTVGFEDGNQQDFLVKYTFEVLPQDSAIIESTDFAQLTIYTCSGFFDTKRFVVVAEPVYYSRVVKE